MSCWISWRRLRIWSIVNPGGERRTVGTVESRVSPVPGAQWMRRVARIVAAVGMVIAIMSLR